MGFSDFPSFEAVLGYKHWILNGGCVYCSQKTVVITLWNDMAIKEGATLSDTLTDAPILVAKALRVGDFQG